MGESEMTHKVLILGSLGEFVTLVKKAKEMGYENYLELGYYRMNRNCYGKDEVEAFRRQIKEYFVPFAEKLHNL